ncbi:hypothetical protein SOVF_157260 [Spinacia oleracea]|nr:hypothetical protein SOVF_157260 [Spinacia oleracea]
MHHLLRRLHQPSYLCNSAIKTKPTDATVLCSPIGASAGRA